MALWSGLFSRPARMGLSTRPSLTLFFLLVGAFLLTLVPHVAQLPLWLTLTVIASMAVRSILEFHRWPLPSPTFCSLLAICLLAGILLQFHSVLGRDAGTAFMAGLLAIKFFELRGSRDILVIIFSCFFVVMSALLYSQVIELFIYCLIMMWVLTALLLRTQMGDLAEDRLLRLLSLSGIIFLQALPLAIFLFFFFPRYGGKLQVFLHDAPIGFTDTVAPGSIAALSRNDAEVMYVKFLHGDIPLLETMYWRGLVLWHYEHGVWTAGALAAVPIPEGHQPSAASGRDLIEQEITIRPHFQKWLFALDSPVSPATNTSEPQPWSTTYNGDILQLNDLNNVNVKLDHKERYDVTSASTMADQVLKNEEKNEGTQFPNDEIDPQVWALASQLRDQAQAQALQLHRPTPDAEDYMQAVFHYFRHGGFIYSSTPGVEGKDWLGDFLFKNKTGFCEHYASAFAILLRLEHIPTRLVVGYQGAIYNPYGNIYTVLQSNAHAWDEVWIGLNNQPAADNQVGHWQRIDPTAILSTSDISSASNGPGAKGANDDLSIRVSPHQLTFLETYLQPWMLHSFLEMQLRREEVEADWDNWVFSYDPETQNRLAQALGFGRKGRYVLALACLIAMGICVIVFHQMMKRKAPLSPIENLYAQFCRNMAQRGISRATWEGPLAYTGRVAEAFPEKKEAIRDVGRIVAQARYGSNPDKASTAKELKSLLLLITAAQAASSSRERS